MATDSLNVYLRKKKLLCPLMNVPKHYEKVWGSNASEMSKSAREAYDEQENTLSEQNAVSRDLAMSNYIILKEILGQLVSWQDLKLVSYVCQAWADVVKNITKHCSKSQVFCLYWIEGVTFEKEYLRTEPEPLLILAFANSKSLQFQYSCSEYPDSPCDRDCKAKHKMMDYVHAALSYPSRSLVVLSCERVLYYPPSIKDNRENRINFNEAIASKGSCTCGVILPKIAGVHVHTVDSKLQCEAEIPLIRKISKIMETEIIKCILVFVGNQYEHLEPNFLTVIQTIRHSQPGVSVAVGGCRVNTSYHKHFNLTAKRDGQPFCVLLFSVDKTTEEEVNFDCYSAVFLEDHDIESKMKQLSEFPRRESSAAFKLSCVGRTDLDQQEHELFSKYFPATSLVGCYGQQEVGLDCYPSLQLPVSLPSSRRRAKTEQDSLFHSYSTIMVVFSWVVCGVLWMVSITISTEIIMKNARQPKEADSEDLDQVY